MGDTNFSVLRLRGYRGSGRPCRYDSEDEKRITRKIVSCYFQVPPSPIPKTLSTRISLLLTTTRQRNIAPHNEDGMNSEPLNTIPQRISALGSPLPLCLAAPERARIGPGRLQKYERGIWRGPSTLVLAESEIG